MKKLNEKQKQYKRFIFVAMTAMKEAKMKWDNDYFHLILRHFPEYNSEGRKTWQKLDLYKKHHKFTERAVKVLEEKQNEAGHKDFHYEHIEPVSITKNKLEKIFNSGDFLEKDIEKALSNCEVYILSKNEQRILDGKKGVPVIIKGNQPVTLDGISVPGAGLQRSGTVKERMDAIGAKIHKDYKNKNLF